MVKLVELRTFISATLLDIIGGVKDAQEKSDLDTIVPEVDDTFQSLEAGISNIQVIDFEVTVNADERSGTETKINVVAAILGGSTKAGSDKAGGHAATLKFRVPVRLSRKGE